MKKFLNLSVVVCVGLVLGIFYPITGFTAEATLGWDPNSEPNIAGYEFFYGTASRNYDYQTDVGNNTSATVSGLEEGITYFFSVTAYNTQSQSSGFSNEVIYCVPDTTPPGPTILTSMVANAGEFILNWPPSSDPDAASYVVFLGTTPGIYTQSWSVGDVTSFVITDAFADLTDGQVYYAAMKVVDTSGNESPYSNELSATYVGPPPTGPPPAPASVTAVRNGFYITVTCDVPSGADWVELQYSYVSYGYATHKAMNENGTLTVIFFPTMPFYYRVVAFNVFGDSPFTVGETLFP